MWASVTFMSTRQTNPRTKIQLSQQRQFSEFARNWTRELTEPCSNRMARKCEQAWHSCQQDKPIHVRSTSLVKDVSSPSSLGMEPVSWLYPVQKIEWQGNVSKQAWHSYEQNKPIHVPRYSRLNDVSSPSSLGIEPTSWLDPVQKIGWQVNRSVNAKFWNENDYFFMRWLT
jgi:hypothetical protein